MHYHTVGIFYRWLDMRMRQYTFFFLNDNILSSF